jgi:DNA-binding Xre family transcriptional regulator
MPTYIDIEKALFEWQAKYGQRMTNEELAERAGLSIAALYRMKSGDMLQPDLRKINEICKVLECEPGDIIVREATRPIDEAMRLEVERLEILRELEEKFQKQQERKEASSSS